MADNNITQILAALAAQKSEGTPSVGAGPSGVPPPMQQPHGAPTYQHAYPMPTPPANASGFALPQPSSSGSVDLSNIKPTNSGSMNFEDAMSRARGIAAEKRGLYDQGRNTPLRENDSRSRGYRRSRSRSRSPPRYRDNYNPYRDERRGAGYPRERSMSPQRRSDYPGRGFGTPDQQQQQLQPPPQQLQGNDSGIETIQIDSSLVGLIIGRQGENLRRVEGETGTRVQFMTGPEAQGPHRLCKISGPRPAREHAKAEINRIIEDNAAQKGPNAVQDHTRMGSQPPALSTGEENTQIMVPNRTVGLIIGRGGETIRDLQQRSGCHVNIVGEEKSVNGLRPVNLIGTPQAAKVAKDLIMEIVESDNKTMATGGAGGGANVGGGGSGHPGNVQSNQHRGGDGGGGGGADKINDTIVVPSEAVGMIIGKGGETIKDMQLVTGCKINVSQPSGPDFERDIGLIGSRPSIEHAKRAIMEKVHAVEEKNRSGGGGGGRQPPRDQYNQYSQQQQPQQQQYPPQSGTPSAGYGQPPAQYGQPQGGAGAPPGGEEAYAAYGGYQAYIAMWYAAMQQQQNAAGGQPGSGQPPA